MNERLNMPEMMQAMRIRLFPFELPLPFLSRNFSHRVRGLLDK